MTDPENGVWKITTGAGKNQIDGYLILSKDNKKITFRDMAPPIPDPYGYPDTEYNQNKPE